MNNDTFTIDLENIDVEDIMRQIRAKIKAKEISDDINLELPALGTDAELEDHLRMANMSYNIQPHLPITSHRKVIGKGIIFCKRITRKLLKWYINPIAEQQETFNSHSVRTLNSMAKKLEQVIEVQGQEIKVVKEYEKQVDNLENRQDIKLEHKIKIIKEKLQEVEAIKEKLQEVDTIKEKLQEVEAIKEKSQEVDTIKEKLQEVEVFKQRLEEVLISEKELENRTVNLEQWSTQKSQELQNQLISIMQQNELLKQQNNLLNARCRRIERHLKQQNVVLKEPEYKLVEQEKVDFDYFLFEEQYRGSEEMIKERLNVYLPYFKETQNVLDIGCGRGEFLEILKEQGVSAKGIEIDDEMLLICEEKGLDVEKMDAIAYLESVEDHSLGGIILTQVIEHLGPNYLIKLMRLAYQKLQYGAYMVAETINPQSLIVFTEAYFMDLSHVKMVHPLTIKFILESEGFRDIDLKYLSPVGEELRIPMVKDMPNEFNTAIEKLNNVVYGCRDYAAIGRK